jgi:NADPH:quinone reductase-like Zn-dependent oxidoreductase
MNRAIALQQMRPVIDRVFPFAQVRTPCGTWKRAHFGKICVRV